MQINIPDDKYAALTEMIFSGQKIAAIKLYREFTNAGLKEAKDEVEAIEAKLRTESPERFTSPPKSGSGCSGVVIFVAILVSILVYWLITKR